MLSDSRRTINHLWSQPLRTAGALRDLIDPQLQHTQSAGAQAPGPEDPVTTCLLLLDSFESLSEGERRWVQVACLRLHEATPPSAGEDEVLRAALRSLGRALRGLRSAQP